MDPNGNYMGNFGIPFANYGGIYFPVYNNEMETESDLRFMKEMYPVAAKNIQALVERELDTLDKEGSLIYDEYPDRVQLLRISGRIYDQAILNLKEENGFPSPWGECQGENCRDRRLEDFIYVILLNEIFKRRADRRIKNKNIIEIFLK